METTLVQPKGVSEDLLRRAIPAIFATAPDSRVSDGYSFIPTEPLMRAVIDQGFVLTGAQMQLAGRGRKVSVKETGAHMLRFRHVDIDPLAMPDGFPEIVLINSHDRTKRFRLLAGVFRMICSNGIIVGTHTMQPIVQTHYHIRESLVDVVTGVNALAARTGMLTETISRMQHHEMTPERRVSFAEEAIKLRYRGYNTGLSPELLSSLARRDEDTGNTLWRVFNRVQEHLMKGGLSTGRSHTRPMASLFENVSVNMGLWDLAEKELAVANN